jgi:XTP/dITP diphosphohydrolase
VSEASCEGTIAFEPKGANGFGFDPLFVPAGYVETFAELPNEVKARISHRAKALSATRAFRSLASPNLTATISVPRMHR